MADWIATQVYSSSDWYQSLDYIPRISNRLFLETGTLKDFPNLSLQSLAVIFFNNGIFKQVQENIYMQVDTEIKELIAKNHIQFHYILGTYRGTSQLLSIYSKQCSSDHIIVSAGWTLLHLFLMIT